MRRAASPIVIPTAVDAAVGVKQDLIDREIVLKGKFDAEIARLKKIKEDAEEKLSAVGGLAEAQKILAEADERAAKINADVDKVVAAAEATLAKAKAREKAVAEREHAVSARESEFSGTVERTEARAKDLERISLERDASNQSRVKEIEALATQLAAAQAAHRTALAALAEREKRFNARLEALKVTEA